MVTASTQRAGGSGPGEQRPEDDSGQGREGPSRCPLGTSVGSLGSNQQRGAVGGIGTDGTRSQSSWVSPRETL